MTIFSIGRAVMRDVRDRENLPVGARCQSASQENTSERRTSCFFEFELGLEGERQRRRPSDGGCPDALDGHLYGFVTQQVEMPVWRYKREHVVLVPFFIPDGRDNQYRRPMSVVA